MTPSEAWKTVAMTCKEQLQMNIHVIIQVKKIQEFNAIQVLFKPSSIFESFDWYNNQAFATFLELFDDWET